ncbi:MAG: LytR C-terminal domain-containing protein [Gemmatimonadetes bacterium]|nr:LytR C-terminal domain-containing protein [Gemmatimonadota bacterium]
MAAVVMVAGLGPWIATGMTMNGTGGSDTPANLPSDSLAKAPDGVRIRVHVTNASGVRGLARQATMHLRARGFDVVGIDTERGAPAMVTEVAVHAGPPEHGHRVRRALGAGGLVVRPDSTRYVEVRVRLGRDWKPSSQALRP